MDVDEFDVDRGDKLSCPECGANLEVVGLSPVELELASDEVDEDEGLQGENQLDD
jgi:lysine biosynthesis protein LysW